MAAENTPLRKVLLLDEEVDFCRCRWQVWAEHYPDHWELHVGQACHDCQTAIEAMIKEVYPSVPRKTVY